MSTPASTNSKIASLQRATPIRGGDFLLFLGKRVRHIRNLRGMTRKLVARDSDVSERHLAQLEAGGGNGTIVSPRGVAGALKVSLFVCFAPREREPSGRREEEWCLKRRPLTTCSPIATPFG